MALLRPRQVGKTALALEIARTRDSLYLDLEDRNDRNRLSEPALFLDGVEDRLVILDEIHRMPDLFQTLRGVIHRGRRRGRGRGRFLILGSASMGLLRQAGETSAGRIACVDMAPISVLETGAGGEARERSWLRGGFPDSFLAHSDEDSLAWRKDVVRTHLERDIVAFGSRIAAADLERLLTGSRAWTGWPWFRTVQPVVCAIRRSAALSVRSAAQGATSRVAIGLPQFSRLCRAMESKRLSANV